MYGVVPFTSVPCCAVLRSCSCLEIFTGSGEVLSTRIYRGVSPSNHADPGIEFVALDGEATLERVAAYDMARCVSGEGGGHERVS